MTVLHNVYSQTRSHGVLRKIYLLRGLTLCTRTFPYPSAAGGDCDTFRWGLRLCLNPRDTWSATVCNPQSSPIRRHSSFVLSTVRLLAIALAFKLIAVYSTFPAQGLLLNTFTRLNICKFRRLNNKATFPSADKAARTTPFPHLVGTCPRSLCSLGRYR